MARRHYYRKSGRGKPPKPYKSWLERDLHKGAMKGLPYESIKVPYTIDTTYTPDFVNEDKKILFEAKGRFEDSKEAAKYTHFAQCHPEWQLIFIFENPNTPMPRAKRRLNGTRFSHSDWADKHGFDWCSPKTVKEEWL